MGGRLLRTGVAALGLGLGMGLGAQLGARYLPAATTAVAAPSTNPFAGPDFTVIAQRATPAVVNISAVQVLRTERSPFFSDPFFREFFGRDNPFRMPQEERKTSLGSGVIVGSDGLIVTNNHVIEKARQIAVTTADGKRRRGTLLGSDPTTDVAVLRVEGSGLASLPWGDSARAAVGEYVLAVGNPFQLNQTVTMGIISALGRSNVGIVDYEDFIQTDAAINPGNSGGALVNARGELIGINTAIYSETGGYQGVGFAVPANLARTVVDQLVTHGRVVRGFVGITRIGDVTATAAEELGLRSPRGAVVVELLRRSPADLGGIEPGDVVLEADGKPLENAAQLRNVLASVQVGSDLRLTVLRDGRRIEARIRVREATPDA